MKIMDDIIEAVDGGSVVALASLDISAAFDAVDHDILVRRLEDEFGITGTCSRWIQSYLTDRSTVVHVGKSSSTAAAVHFGVPQGSVLGPILYTAYVAPVGRLITSFGVQFHQYADDTQLYTKLTIPASSGLDRLRQCVDALQHWFGLSGLLLNPDKSVVVYFGTSGRLKRTELPSHVTIGDSDVIVSDKLTVLGVTIDSKLSMDQHINNVVRNCNFHLQALRHIRSSVSHEVANTIACSLVHSRMDYCNSLLLGVSKQNVSKLQRIQNNAARIVCCANRRQFSASNLLLNLHWLPVCDRIVFKTAVLCFKAYRLSKPHYLSAVLRSYNPTRALRSSSSELLVSRSARTKLGDRRFSIAAAHVWNDLPLTCRTADSFTVFKSRLKTHLFRRNIV